jgi:type VI protein secretion system component VasF
MAGPEALPLLLRFVRQYRVAHPDGGEVERKLERLLAQLRRVSPPPEAETEDAAAARGATARIDRTTRLR